MSRDDKDGCLYAAAAYVEALFSRYIHLDRLRVECAPAILRRSDTESAVIEYVAPNGGIFRHWPARFSSFWSCKLQHKFESIICSFGRHEQNRCHTIMTQITQQEHHHPQKQIQITKEETGGLIGFVLINADCIDRLASPSKKCINANEYASYGNMAMYLV